MDFLDAIKWIVISQQFYRLAIFKVDKSYGKLFTDNLQVLLSFGILGIVFGEVFYCGYNLMYTNENMIKQGEGKIA